MSYIEIALISISLAMDAFAVAVCKGLSFKKSSTKKSIIVASYFGIFQLAMNLIGYLVGERFEKNIIQYDHWIVFVLLSFIGTNMIIESFNKNSDSNDKIDFKSMLPLSLATSIDSLAVGISFALLEINIYITIAIIGIITFIISFVGTKIGNLFGDKYKTKATVIGGIILIIIGVKILFEHLHIVFM